MHTSIYSVHSILHVFCVTICCVWPMTIFSVTNQYSQGGGKSKHTFCYHFMFYDMFLWLKMELVDDFCLLSVLLPCFSSHNHFAPRRGDITPTLVRCLWTHVIKCRYLSREKQISARWPSSHDTIIHRSVRSQETRVLILAGYYLCYKTIWAFII